MTKRIDFDMDLSRPLPPDKTIDRKIHEEVSRQLNKKMLEDIFNFTEEEIIYRESSEAIRKRKIKKRRNKK